jgi:Domain of unknown function (DUF4282)
LTLSPGRATATRRTISPPSPLLYVLVVIVAALGALAFLLFAFRMSTAFGVSSLVILCPLYFFINVALWRILLELFVVVFRIADDIRAIRMRGDLR